jgi:hypothetical protein
MKRATRTFHADVFDQDCEVGYHIADSGTMAEKPEAVIDHVTNYSLGTELLPTLDEQTVENLAREAAEWFRDAQAADRFGVESV